MISKSQTEDSSKTPGISKQDAFVGGFDG